MEAPKKCEKCDKIAHWHLKVNVNTEHYLLWQGTWYQEHTQYEETIESRYLCSECHRKEHGDILKEDK